MPRSIEALKGSREGYKLNIRKTLKRITEIYVNRDSTTPIELDLRELHDRLSTYEQELITLNEQILEFCNDSETTDETVNNLDFRELVWSGYSEINAMLDALKPRPPPHASVQQQAAAATSAHANPSSQQTLAVRLPKYELPQFDGDPMKFMEFWDIFEATVHNRSDIADVEKLQYLKNALKGEAAKLAESYRLTNPMYAELVDKLKERFGKPDAAVVAHIDQLWKLAKATNETRSLQRTFDECDRHVRSLSALGYSESQFGMILAPIIIAKMPWHIKLALNKENKSKMWTMDGLRKALREEIEAREMADQSIEKEDKNPRWSRSNYQTQHYNQPYRNKPVSTSALSNETKPYPYNREQQLAPTCAFCKGRHFSDECRKVSSTEQRKKIAINSHLCFNCLRANHSAKECRRAKPCFHCRGSGHHSSLCNKRTDTPKQQGMLTSTELRFEKSSCEPEDYTESPDVSYNLTATNAVFNARNKQVYMQMSAVKLKAPDGTQVVARLLFDSGSTCSYITEELQRKLKLPTTGFFNLANARFGDSERQVKSYPCVSLSIPTSEGEEDVPLSLFVTERISCGIQKQPLDPRQYPILRKIKLADPITRHAESHEIDILVGGDHYFDIVLKRQIRLHDGLVLVESKLGYIPSGCLRAPKSDNEECLLVSCFLNGALTESALHVGHVERFWKLEEIGIRDDAVTPDDDRAVAQFEESVREVNGRLTVGWPWKTEEPDLPANRELALARFSRLIHRIAPKKEIIEAYDNVVQDQLSRDIIEEVTDEKRSDGRIHYLPHHEVIRADHATTKLRVVYDGSAKRNRNEPSLNDCLLRGPVLLGDLCGLLMRFRLHAIAFTADIEKAYLQVGLHAKDRDVTRFFWLRDKEKPADGRNLVVYRFTRVLFGIISSAFLLDATIRYKMLKTGTAVAAAIAQDTYVDNLASGTDTESAAVEFYEEATRLFEEISMNLRAWRTNSTALRMATSDDKRAKATDTKVLGLSWNCDDDSLGFLPPAVANMTVLTKRNLLQAGSKLFDPCGLLAPVSIKAKLLVQELWKDKLKWDYPISAKIKSEWAETSREIDLAAEIKIARYLNIAIGSFQLHGFCDASAKAFASAIYLRSCEPPYQTKLLICKARLAPLKTVTIPRLELMAAVIGTRLLNFAVEQLKLLPTKCFLWSDSKCVLHWLQSVKVLSVFVENRVKEIKRSGFECRYVPTDVNPADLPTKGMTAIELRTSNLWWNGPNFLRYCESDWPRSIPAREISQEMEVETAVAVGQQVLEPTLPFGIDPERYSSIEPLLNLVAWSLRFIGNLKALRDGKEPNKCNRLLPGEKRYAMLLCIRHVQREGFSEERAGKQWNNQKRQLGVFIDKTGLLRCGGRMRHAEITDDAKFPMLLPKGHRFTRLIVRHAHCEALHAGPAHTLAQLRTRFWIPCSMPLVKSVVHGCPWCRIWDKSEYKLPMIAPLPSFRVSRAPPFRNVGVDYFGPLYVKKLDGDEKVWILLFTCAVTRAVHLEVANSMSADQFLLCYRRFAASYGKPDKIVSDNAKQFKFAKKMLFESNNQLADVEWKFIPAFSPWFGGFYERLVKTVKTALKKALGKQLVKLPVLQTVICEVAALVNSRPLTLSTNVHDQILTPAHLLGKESAVARMLDFQASHEITSTSKDLVQMYMDRSKLLEMFWHIWRRDYLTNLRSSHRNHRARPGSLDKAPKVGAVVLLKDEKARTTWPLAVVERLHESNDGAIRSVTVRLGTGVLRVRPVNKLIPLEAEMGEGAASSRADPNDGSTNYPHSNSDADDRHGRSAITSPGSVVDDFVSRSTNNGSDADDSDFSSEF